MRKVTVVYLVGDQDAQKTNSWDAMTNCKEKAIEALLLIPEGQIKAIQVKENYRDSK